MTDGVNGARRFIASLKDAVRRLFRDGLRSNTGEGAGDVWQMPQPMAVLEAIEEWRSLDLRTASFESIVADMEDLRDKLEFSVVQQNSSVPQKLWRVRKREPKDQFDSPSDLWEPPPNKARLNRCNPAGSPLLYCSKDLATALDECEIARGDEFLLVRYRATTGLRLHRIIGSFDPNRPGDHPVIEGDAPLADELRKSLHITPERGPVFDEDGLLAYRIMREFLRAEFTKPVGKGTEPLYKVSAAVCHVWAGVEDADGWIYSSIRSPLKGNENLALDPDAAREKLHIEAAHWCLAEDVAASRQLGSELALPGIRLGHLKIADPPEPEIAWRATTSSDQVPRFAVRK